jgi:hypothetical protein
MRKKHRFARILVIFCLIFVIALLYISLKNRLSLIGKTTEHKVYLALGFHVNLYHSYRTDTNNEAGFGKDIRIIRKIIQVLDDYNRRGIAVRAVWDFDNLFSLQELLPKYAPDIIKDIQRRIREHKDEVILMSYNNGLASALTEDEFRASVRLGIRNDVQSGIQDIFKTYSPIVRPQEMMVTPGNYRLYRKLGIDAIVLYYSAITFDAIRTFIKPLSYVEAFNPLTYRDEQTNEEMLIIPAYNIGDLIENISLKRWARELHREQLRGRIDRDVMIFINFDADDPYWFGYTLPWYMSWLPNTGGLNQLIQDIADLDYIEFTNLADYLHAHPAAGEISFGQDLADGNFNGYNSWSEKATSHLYWTQLMQDRRNHLTVNKICSFLGLNAIPGQVKDLLDKSFQARLRLLSTTNFGMAAPFLAKQREAVVESTIQNMLNSSFAARDKTVSLARDYLKALTPPPSPHPQLRYLEPLLLLNAAEQAVAPSANQNFYLNVGSLSDSQSIYLQATNGAVAVPTIANRKPDGTNSKQVLRLLVHADRALADGIYYLYVGPKGLYASNDLARSVSVDRKILQNDTIRVEFSKKGWLKSLTHRGVQQLDQGSFIPFIHYLEDGQKRKYVPEAPEIEIEASSSATPAVIRLQSAFALDDIPGSLSGSFDYRFWLIENVPYLFIDGTIQYPQAPRNDLLNLKEPQLTRKFDRGWFEVAPLELIFSHQTDKNSPFAILKRNFLDVESAYRLDYFQHSDENLNLACVNNHITSAYVAAVAKNKGIAVAMDNTVQSNFAFCPMKMTYDPETDLFRLRLNPFGTYFGAQYYQPTWSNRQGYEAAILSGQQYASSAPTYNGFSHRFCLMLAFFDGKKIPEKIKQDLLAFAEPAITVSTSSGVMGKTVEQVTEKLSFPKGFLAAVGDDGIYFHWEKARGFPHQYRLYLGTETGRYGQIFSTADTMFILRDFDWGQAYVATVEAVDVNGATSPKSPEISFIAEKSEIPPGPQIPISLQLKILWNGILALLE